MRFSISVHSGFRAPPDALELLWERLGTRHEDIRFTRGTTDIRATSIGDAPVSMERDEREEQGRLAVLGIVQEACKREPELKLDWYAVSPRRY